VLKIITTITRKRGNCDALQLEGHLTSHQSFWALITRSVDPTPLCQLQSPAGADVPTVYRWNSLPQSAVQVNSVNCFKNQLDKLRINQMDFFMDD